jgi:PAS domain S-box-containing protein
MNRGFLDGVCRVGTCLMAAAAEVAVFFLTPVLNRIYDGWPRGWLMMTTAVVAAFFGGLAPGLTAVATAAVLIWSRGYYFQPMHPGLEVFTAIAVFHVLVIHRLQLTRRDLGEQHEAFIKSFHGNAAGMIVTRLEDGTVLDANAAYLRMTGYTREELVGRSTHAIWRSPERRQALVDELRRRGSIENLEATLVRNDGEERTALVSSQAVTIAGKAAIVSSVQDITERTRMEQALRDANSAKDRFLANLSHELRTPLNVVLGYTRMLRTDSAELSADRRRMLDAVERNAVAQLRIVEDLLDAQRIATGKLALARTSVDLKKLQESVVDSLSPTLQAKGIHYHVDFDPITLDADGARLQQVFWNLLSNAVKFTPEGGCIGLYGKRRDGHVTIQVVNSGEGIPAHFLPHVFERFRQLDESSTRRHSGLGLGLAIAQEIVRLHGGEIRADSAGPNQGATFTVTLPVHPP